MWILTDKTGRVTSQDFREAAPKGAGWIDVGEAAVPSLPEVGERQTAELYWTAEDGFRWEVIDLPPPPELPGPTPEEAREAVRQARQAAYREQVDPLTAEIARLRDMAPDDPRIAEAEAEREVAVASVVAEYPYPSEEA